MHNIRKPSLKSAVGLGLTAAVLATLQGCGSDSAVTPTAATTGDQFLVFPETKAFVEGIVTELDLDDLDNMTNVAQVVAGKPSDILMWGLDLENTLNVTLGGKTCLVYDVGVFEEYDENSKETEAYVKCPSFPVGTQKLVVVDTGAKIYETDVKIVSAAVLSAGKATVAAKSRPNFGSVFGATKAANPFGVSAKTTVLAASPGVVTGRITGDAPTVSTETGGHDYSTPQKFNVRGVVVKLLDAANNNAELATTVSNGDGVYSFENIPTGRNLKVQVVAQLALTRANGVTTGAQYNFTVRDNTSSGDEKTIYSLTSDAFQSVAEGNLVSINAGLGFDSAGVANNAERKSAPFSILDVVYNAANGIAAANPNVTLPAVNIYWSTENRPEGGDRSTGQISTSHFADSGSLPGVFILGKADVDTDEFDRGVIGHEFGHYLQHVASYSDNPGGNHANGDYKDASLAYGEGFGTAIGGLLAGSNFYIDSSGAKQARGGVTNLETPPTGKGRTGFYAEGAIGHLLYKLGKTFGFTAFWNTTTALTAGFESATVFNFLAKLVAQPDVKQDDVVTAAAAVNIKSIDPKGVLSQGAAADSEISATASGGATDLETLYLTLSPTTPADTAAVVKLTDSPPSFCFNSKLPGANLANGLGSSKRFVFTSNHDGAVGAKLSNAEGKFYPDQVVYATIRDGSTGKKTPAYGWSDQGIAQWNVKKGVTYSVKLNVRDSSMLAAQNTCGLQLSLFNTPAINVE